MAAEDRSVILTADVIKAKQAMETPDGLFILSCAASLSSNQCCCTVQNQLFHVAFDCTKDR